MMPVPVYTLCSVTLSCSFGSGQPLDTKVRPFGNPLDRNGARCFVPKSQAYYGAIYRHQAKVRQPWQRGLMKTIHDPRGGYSLDICHKNACSERDSSHQKVGIGHLTVMCSTTKQVAMQVSVASTSLQDPGPATALRQLGERAEASGKPVSSAVKVQARVGLRDASSNHHKQFAGSVNCSAICSAFFPAPFCMLVAIPKPYAAQVAPIPLTHVHLLPYPPALQVTMMYTDSTRKDERILKELLPTLEYTREDGFHGLNRITKSCHTRHPMLKPFSQRLSAAMYLLVRDDYRKVVSGLQAKGLDDAEIAALGHPYFRKRCRTVIPPPAILAARLQCVYEEGLKMKANMEPLYSATTAKAFSNLMELVRLGKFSGKGQGFVCRGGMSSFA